MGRGVGLDLRWSSCGQRAGPWAPFPLPTALRLLSSRTAGYVESIMGRRRPLPRIRAHDPQLRAQAERQAVNFVVQGAGAPLLPGCQPRRTGDCRGGPCEASSAGSRHAPGGRPPALESNGDPSHDSWPKLSLHPWQVWKGPAHLPGTHAGGGWRAHVLAPPALGAPGLPGGGRAGA